MRAISLVDRQEFDFTGNVLRNALKLGDVDNDGTNELIVGNENGEVVIFKGTERWQTLSGLNFVSCIAVGDVLNKNKNDLVVITGDGWCHIYSYIPEDCVVLHASDVPSEEKIEDDVEQVDGGVFSNQSSEEIKRSTSTNSFTSSTTEEKPLLQRIHVQRIPPNTKDILLGDIDSDGLIELVLGLTDRVVRSYRWFKDSEQTTDSSTSREGTKTTGGKLVGLNKWECAKQIGSITLHHGSDGGPSLLVAQPGGTFMRIVCQSEEVVAQSLEANRRDSDSGSSQSLIGSKIDYQFLGISRMRNQNISTEIVGNLKNKSYDEQASVETDNSDTASTNSSSSYGISNLMKAPKGNPYAVATLDGTIMLVQNEVILWAMAVDHQIFALTKLDITGNGCDDIIACSWDGQTYILDQNRNAVRFHLDESVQAFECGYYNLSLNSPPVTCFIYATFHNKIYVYYDIPLKFLACKKFEPDMSNLKEILADEYQDESKLDRKQKKDLVEYLLYGVKK